MDNKEILTILETSERQMELMRNAADQLRAKLIIAETKCETWDRISNSNNTIEMSAVAKELNYDNLGRNKIFKILRKMNVLRYNNEPYQQFVDGNYFKVIEQVVDLPNGETMTNRKPVVTAKGIDYIRKKIDKYYEEL